MMASLLLSEMTETKGSLFHFSKTDFDWYTFSLLLTASTISISGFFYAFLSQNWFYFSLFKPLLDCILQLSFYQMTDMISFYIMMLQHFKEQQLFCQIHLLLRDMLLMLLLTDNSIINSWWDTLSDFCTGCLSICFEVLIVAEFKICELMSDRCNKVFCKTKV